MKKVLAFLIIAASALIIRSFYMPWATVETTALKAASEIAKDPEGKLIQAPRLRKALSGIGGIFYPVGKVVDKKIRVGFSGYDIPEMIHGKHAKVINSFMNVLFKDIDNISQKPYIVYGLPAGAGLCILFAILGLWFRPPVILMLMLTEAIGIIGFYNLKTTLIGVDLPPDIAALSIECGIWYTIYAYLFIFCVSFLWLVFDRRK